MITEFTPWASLGGGALIGLASVLLMALHGRIMGAMGLVGGVLRFGNWPDWAMRAAIVAGMVSGPLVVLLVTGQAAALEVPVSSLAMVVSGLIVGVGATFGGGCTSGHGICGNARFSRRSLVATVTFMVTTFATVFVIRHVIGG